MCISVSFVRTMEGEIVACMAARSAVVWVVYGCNGFPMPMRVSQRTTGEEQGVWERTFHSCVGVFCLHEQEERLMAFFLSHSIILSGLWSSVYVDLLADNDIGGVRNAVGFVGPCDEKISDTRVHGVSVT